MIQGQSDHTAEKQYGLEKILSQWLSIVDRIALKWKINYPILYADMNAGSGWNNEVNCIGSPLLFLSESDKHNFKKEIYFIESNANSLIKLAENVNSIGSKDADSCAFINGNHSEIH